MNSKYRKAPYYIFYFLISKILLQAKNDHNVDYYKMLAVVNSEWWEFLDYVIFVFSLFCLIS